MLGATQNREDSVDEPTASGRQPGDGERVEQLLRRSLRSVTTGDCPSALARALELAVLGGGHRFRPRLCLAVSRAVRGAIDPTTEAAATAIELVHCASLVHDDLPCFDDAATRRGEPTVHHAYGEPVAVLTGDALIVMAFDVLAQAAEHDGARAASLIRLLARASGVPHGIITGQAMEGDPDVSVERYHTAKTAALFEAATTMGALAAGGDPARWSALGQRIGILYQLADDVRDVAGTDRAVGKPVGRDAELGRLNAAREQGLRPSLARLQGAIEELRPLIPECADRAALEAFLDELFVRVLVEIGARAEASPAA